MLTLDLLELVELFFWNTQLTILVLACCPGHPSDVKEDSVIVAATQLEHLRFQLRRLDHLGELNELVGVILGRKAHPPLQIVAASIYFCIPRHHQRIVRECTDLGYLVRNWKVFGLCNGSGDYCAF